MKREIIKTEESGNLILPADMDEIAMTEYEIAELFGVFTPTVRAAIKAVYRSGVIQEDVAKRYLRQENENIIEVYSLETIVALAFRIDSFGANKVREYLFRTLRANRRSAVHLLLTAPVTQEQRLRTNRSGIVLPVSRCKGDAGLSVVGKVGRQSHFPINLPRQASVFIGKTLPPTALQ